MEKVIQIFEKENLLNFNNYIFSIGVANINKSELYNQIFYPIYKKKKLLNTVIFAIDNYLNIERNDFAIILSFEKIEFKFIKENVYFNSKNNLKLYLIKENLETSYNSKISPQQNFIESFKYIPILDCWKYFFLLLNYLISLQKSIFINNWAFFNTPRGTDIGHYYELFPELGFILNIINLENKKNNIEILKIFENDMIPIVDIPDFNQKNSLQSKWFDNISKTTIKIQKSHKNDEKLSKHEKYDIIKPMSNPPLKIFGSEEEIKHFINQSMINRNICRMRIKGDGSCLFRSFSNYVNENHLKIREKIVAYENRNMRQLISPIITQLVLSEQIQIQSFDDYIRVMKDKKTYGGQAEIIAFVNLYNKNIAIIDIETDYVNIFMNPNNQPSETIFLLFNRNIKHYDIAWIDENCNRFLQTNVHTQNKELKQKIKGIDDLIYNSLKYNLSIREDIKDLKSIENILEKLYNFYSEKNKNIILESIIKNYDPIIDIFFSKDSIYSKKELMETNRLTRFISLFTNNPIKDSLDKAIFNTMYIIKFQTFSNGNHRTAYYLLIEYLKLLGYEKYVDIILKSKNHEKLNKELEKMHDDKRNIKLSINELYKINKKLIDNIKLFLNLIEKK